MKAREWLDRGKQDADPINAFSCFWCAFNNLFFGTAEGAERGVIRAFLGQRVSEADAEVVLRVHAPEVAYLLSEPVIDMRGNGKDTATNIQSFNAASGSLAKLQEVFMVIYQVRCNLAHGQKSPSRGRDVRLCECASPLVAHVVEITGNS